MGKRKKKIRHDINEFQCGLDYQIERFLKYAGNYTIDLTITISDMDKYKFNSPYPFNINLIEVSNKGFDFSGYSTFFKQKILQSPSNSYVILTNSSVEQQVEEFLDGYIAEFNKDPTIGILGISCNSKIYQTFQRNNFRPHVGGFFMMTTCEILKKIYSSNHNKFPGQGITHKLLLIRKGEVKISDQILKMGYKLAFVLNDGKIYKFGHKNIFDNGYATWKLPKGDYRLYTKTPNRITPIKNSSL